MPACHPPPPGRQAARAAQALSLSPGKGGALAEKIWSGGGEGGGGQSDKPLGRPRQAGTPCVGKQHPPPLPQHQGAPQLLHGNAPHNDANDTGFSGAGRVQE